METLELKPDPEEEAHVREIMERMRKNSEVSVTMTSKVAPKAKADLLGRNDQWKRGGICEMCRRQSYCKKTCSAHRDHEDGKIASYFRRLASDPDIRKALKEAEKVRSDD